MMQGFVLESILCANEIGSQAKNQWHNISSANSGQILYRMIETTVFVCL